ncbi:MULTISPECIES: hypothetical protein [Phaeobacter]|uniref:hypothetical protein n=1 Tax=Phaeobacter TaxID=302485 RepID=UPI000802F177
MVFASTVPLRPLLLLRRLLAGFFVLCTLSLPARAVELVMVEQHGCEWCARWNEEIAPIYPKTAEGAFAPLRRVDLRNMPDDLETTRRVLFTPTFLIVEDGHEKARLEGYPGADFFWPLLEALLRDHADFAPDGEVGDS